jgi:CheY-like chemotaxis protein
VGSAFLDDSRRLGVAFVLDLTERYRGEAERRARQVAEAANRSKSEFLATMSHELRTPLNGILGYAQLLLRDRALSERQRTSVQVIQDSGEQLLNLIKDVLDLAKVEAGRLELHPAEISLPEFLREILNLIAVNARQRGLHLVEDWTPELPTRIRADEQCLRRVLLNLLSNAVKFTDQGSITLKVRCPSPDRLRFEVSDTGIGVPENEVERIFEPFQQLADSARRAGGTGLGLTISRRLVERMGGTLRLESRIGQGSTFGFELPLQTIEHAPEPPHSTTPVVTGYEGPRRKILIVDDIPASRALLRDWLHPLGFATAEANNGAQGLQQAMTERPDLILMDLAMPEMDGLQAIRSLRASAALRDIPIIAISAGASEHEGHNSLAAGANAFLPKPIDLARLEETLGALLKITWTCE